MSRANLPRVLCVDDEARVLEGLTLHLRKNYEVHTALSGDEALKKLRGLKGGVAVVISDMRMPGMDGAALLHHIMRLYPDTCRMLLTGEPGRDAAIAAVNQAQIFRFLTKPCPPDQLKSSIEAGVAHYRLLNAERSILQETVLGCIQALLEVLGITNPIAFGRTSRIRKLAMDFAKTIEGAECWQLEASAMLSQIGYLSLPLELVERLYYGEKITPEEKVLADGVPKVAINLLEHIPRLEPVIQILTALNWNDLQIARLGNGTIGICTRILGLVLEYDSLVAQRHPVDVAVQTLRSRGARYTPGLIEQFATFLGAGPACAEEREIPLKSITAGMTLMQDVLSQMGTLLIPRGLEVTPMFLERIKTFGPELLAEVVKVQIPAAKAVS
jgi:response regulator RpfG family c-di-GMP phosphodiesterase